MAGMLLKAYLKTLRGAGEKDAFALRCGAALGHLRNVAAGKKCAHILAARIETNSHGQVTRQELCPDWREVWPELVPAKKARRVAAAKVPTVAKKASAARPAADQRSGEERRKSPLVVIPDLRKGPRRQEH